MKKVLLHFGDGEFEEGFLIEIPDSVRKSDINVIVKDVRQGKVGKYNLPEDWSYDEVIDVILKEVNGERVDVEYWDFHL
ncbi:MAG: hypothetical protein DRN17_07860 [Thermoplasmata archaeon]|nr:MAG: hypothetical protein DRN17_07860 [Thermoplasmata archaeon]